MTVVTGATVVADSSPERRDCRLPTSIAVGDARVAATS